MDAITQMIYGDPETYTAPKAVKAGRLVQLGTRAAVTCEAIAKGKAGKVFVHGDFFFDCPEAYEVEDSAPVAYDFKRRRFVPVGTAGSLIVGAALFATPRGGKFIGLQLNG